MVDQYIRWDFLGLSTDAKPTAANEKVTNGSTYYETDTSKYYVYYEGTWYEKTSSGGGGGTSYTAGEGIDIANNKISVDTNTIQEKLTAGANVSISDENVISATDTTYSNFTGTDGTSAGTAGLVPAPATTDAGKFLKADGTWDTAGGSSVTVVQTTGTSTTDVMSQNAVTSMVYADPTTKNRVRLGSVANVGSVETIAIGSGSTSGGANARSKGCISIGISSEAGTSSQQKAIAIGNGCKASNGSATALGASALASAQYSVAIGSWSKATIQGQVDFSTSNSGEPYGYNSTSYRLLTGLYDPQSAHDAATKGYVDPTSDSSAPTTATVGRLGQIFIDTTTATAYMCVAVDDVTPAYTWKQITA